MTVILCAVVGLVAYALGLASKPDPEPEEKPKVFTPRPLRLYPTSGPVQGPSAAHQQWIGERKELDALKASEEAGIVSHQHAAEERAAIFSHAHSSAAEAFGAGVFVSTPWPVY
jgi:hypothetical protein